MIDAKHIWDLRRTLQRDHPLIHCITNPISINDCANAILAMGAKPIMAQHPDEVIQITSQSSALAINLGNFDAVRAAAMKRSAEYAASHEIVTIIDVCGVGCSTLRYEFAQEVLHRYHPAIIKGNLSEIKTLAGLAAHAQGIDVGDKDKEEITACSSWMMAFAKHQKCILVCTGETDLITDGKDTYFVGNGHEMMTLCTGTGCMLNAIIAAFLAICDPMTAALCGCIYLGISAEMSYAEAPLPGTFHMKLFDWLYALTEKDIENNINLRRL